jgi:iron(III) transport system ATP-binding protein
VLLFQEPRLFPHLTALENILLPLTMHNQTPSHEKQERISDWLNKLNLFSFRETYPHHLSGGMKRKVSLLRALVTDPDFLLLDEPFQSLDPDSKQTIISEILPEFTDTPILFTTHDLLEIPLLASSVLYFKTPYLCKPNIIEAVSFEKLFTKHD